MSTIRLNARRAALTGVAAAAALVLATTGGITAASPAMPATTTATVSPATTADEHNQADVTFAQQMIPHHRQAVVMAQMVRSHSSSGEVEALADRIEKAQTPEIETMASWLKAWGEKVPEGMGGMQDMPGMGHDDTTSTPGMMDDHRMTKLDHASGRSFDTMFLTMMIEHHEDAIDMAKKELRQGSYGPAKDLATDIIRTQTAEIVQMRAMLNTR
ncbi:DUF305 domain-containing protein [Streptomyces sp. NPDC059851]|uniref:DUF305 domain-containing protein n=1 Tax=Streptomyces sp. NPDC059851 TaxID=3346971 RepID=UPI003655219A